MYIHKCNKQFWYTQIASLKVFFEMGFALYAAFGGYLSHTVQGWWDVLVSKGACSLSSTWVLSLRFTRWKERTDSHQLSSDIHMYVMCCVCAYVLVCVCLCMQLSPEKFFSFNKQTRDRSKAQRLGAFVPHDLGETDFWINCVALSKYYHRERWKMRCKPREEAWWTLRFELL